MGCLGNIIWLIFGGLETAVCYFVYGAALCCTIIGIPFGLQLFKLGVVCLWPFGTKVGDSPEKLGCLNFVLNAVFFIVAGVLIFLVHIFFGCLLFITIIGIPWGYAHFRLAKLSLMPFGREIVF
jgi:uncharacterized membrane protein YccF (DUF307 family)